MPVIPKKYSAEVAMPPKRLMRRLDGDMTEYLPTVNVLSISRFMRDHKTESIYYGRYSADSFQMFYHKAKKRDGGSTGFYGKVKKTDKGSLITGVFRKPLYAYVFAVIWTLLFLLSAGGAYGSGAAKTAYVILAVGAAGLWLILWDDHEKYLRMYLDRLPRPDNKEEAGNEKT
mgnify:CR=1 FL=1